MERVELIQAELDDFYSAATLYEVNFETNSAYFDFEYEESIEYLKNHEYIITQTPKGWLVNWNTQIKEKENDDKE